MGSVKSRKKQSDDRIQGHPTELSDFSKLWFENYGNQLKDTVNFLFNELGYNEIRRIKKQ